MCNFIDDIKENYLKMERELVTQLNYNVNNHHLTAGSYREEIWADFFRRIVPKKFNITRSVFIIDSKGKVSKEVDIAIYDEQYTPYIFNYGLIKFIPVEAVAAVIQCKSKKPTGSDLNNWAKSIDDLQTSNDSIVRLATYVHIGKEEGRVIQTATKPIKILCYIPKKISNKSQNKSKTKQENGKNGFDILIEAYQNNDNKESKDNNNKYLYDGNLKITFTDNNLLEVLLKYNQADKNYNRENNDNEEKTSERLKEREIMKYKIVDETKEYTLLSFIFQFNQMLMMINNPMFFPHMAYVEMFNKNGGDGK
ncbi:DUF6602 domain-containing protein [Peptoanaerobacter stomatis]|uniref:DUF6602 domain-containing protein n=1 Tax=Peptoanaerobacter stomatis TaxID=796937 RepID=UPI003F9ECBF3